MSISYRLNWLWRLIATGAGFVFFGIGAVILSLCVFPCIWLLVRDRRKRERCSRYLIHCAFRCTIECLVLMGVMTYSVDNAEKMKKSGQLIMANHPCFLDVVLLIAFIPDTNCIVKGSLLKNPFTMLPMRLAGYIANDDPSAVVAQASDSLDRGSSLIIFPEGTRGTPGKEIALQRGAANIALASTAIVAPVLIRCQPLTLTKGSKWYQIPDRSFRLTLSPQPILDIEAFRHKERTPLLSRRLTGFLKNYFVQELQKHECFGN